MSNHKNIRRCSPALLSLIILFLGLTACGTISDAFQPDPAEEYYLPPTAAEEAIRQIVSTPTSSSTEATPTPDTRPSPTPQCNNDLLFVEDLTIPDGTVVLPDATLDKRWQVENSGSCNWDERYRMKLVSGSDLGTPPEQALYPARSGTQAAIRVLFTTPSEPGTYRSAWQAFTPLGEPFGEPFYIEIAVESP
jgi:hypothetical protein